MRGGVFAIAIGLAFVFRYLFPSKAKPSLLNKSRHSLSDRYKAHKTKSTSGFVKTRQYDSDSDDPTPAPTSRNNPKDMTNKDEILKLMNKYICILME